MTGQHRERQVRRLRRTVLRESEFGGVLDELVTTRAATAGKLLAEDDVAFSLAVRALEPPQLLARRPCSETIEDAADAEARIPDVDVPHRGEALQCGDRGSSLRAALPRAARSAGVKCGTAVPDGAAAFVLDRLGGCLTPVMTPPVWCWRRSSCVEGLERLIVVLLDVQAGRGSPWRTGITEHIAGGCGRQRRLGEDTHQLSWARPPKHHPTLLSRCRIDQVAYSLEQDRAVDSHPDW